MDFVDIILKQIEGESELKKPVNALICFARPETGKALMTLVSEMMKENAENASISIVNLVDKANLQQIQDKEVYKSELFADILAQNRNEKIALRTFLIESEHFVDDIIQLAREQNSDIIFTGIGQKLFATATWNNFVKLNEEKPDETPHPEINKENRTSLQKTIHSVSSLLERNPLNSGILLLNNFSSAKRIFVPILSHNDIPILRYAYQWLKNEDVTVKVWDATGILQIVPKLKKVFQLIVKKSESRISLWDDNVKIDDTFIKSNDLIITGIHGWRKMITSALSWIHSLPSVLIIKEKSSEQ